MEINYIGLFVYVFVMIYIILGCGFTFAPVACWWRDAGMSQPGWLYLKETIIAVLTWPWFDIKKLRIKYLVEEIDLDDPETIASYGVATQNELDRTIEKIKKRTDKKS